MESRGTADATYRAYAIHQAYEKISGIEHGTVTPAMKRIEAEDPERHLAGLENSLKGMDRLTEKVNFDVQKKGVTVDQAVANVKDAIRYTLCYSEVTVRCSVLSRTRGCGALSHRAGWSLVPGMFFRDAAHVARCNRWRSAASSELNR